MSYTPISANKAQVEKIYKKHLRFPVIFTHYSYDSEDSVGFFKCRTITGRIIQCQDRKGEPMFIEFINPLSSIRYDISYPKKLNEKLYNRLKKLMAKTRKHFWAGGEI